MGKTTAGYGAGSRSESIGPGRQRGDGRGVPSGLRPGGVDLPVGMGGGLVRAVGVVAVPVRVLADRPGLRLDLVSLQLLRFRQLRIRFAPLSTPPCFLPAGDRPLHPRGKERPLGAASARRAVPPGGVPPRRCPSLPVESSAPP